MTTPDPVTLAAQFAIGLAAALCLYALIAAAAFAWLRRRRRRHDDTLFANPDHWGAL